MTEKDYERYFNDMKKQGINKEEALSNLDQTMVLNDISGDRTGNNVLTAALNLDSIEISKRAKEKISSKPIDVILSVKEWKTNNDIINQDRNSWRRTGNYEKKDIR